MPARKSVSVLRALVCGGFSLRRGAAELRRDLDEDRRVRCAGTLAVAQLAQRGTSTSDAVPGLIAVLSDEDRYNRFYAHLALGHMDDETARAALLDALFTARWCSLTTSEDRY